jgi:8-oxo-dGTP diphosphatase
MKVLATITEQDVSPGAPVSDTSSFSHRKAVRAVVLDDAGQVALLHVSRKGYHKLPGGGIDEGEDMHAALERELLEEIGCRVRIIAEVGEVREYRDEWQQYQESYCFLAKLEGSQKSSEFTQEEQGDGFEPMWAESIEEAIAILEADTPSNYDGSRIKPRDIILLKAAREILASGVTI